MALCSLLSKHQENEGWPNIVFAYTINHNVRPESTSESNMVGKWVQKIGSLIYFTLTNFRIYPSRPRPLFIAK
jgi:tRNA(Ile)-lysidine synthase TilS/MesJ